MNKIIVLQHQDKMIYSKEFLEIKTPKNVNILLYTILIFIFLIINIISFAKIDDVIKVTGIVRTKENVSNVKNVISGKIIEINFRPGQQVSKGDFLYAIDSTVYDNKKDFLLSELHDTVLKFEGVEQLLKSYYEEENFVNIYNEVAYSRFESYLENLKRLYIQEELSLCLLQNEKNLPVNLQNNSVTKQREFDYELNKSAVRVYKSDFLKAINAEKVDLELLRLKLLQEIQQLDSQYEFLKVFAPVDGFVQEASSLNINDYIESGVNVLNIIPNDSQNFRVEMQISPKDMGKIHNGLRVKYRLSAFPFVEYKGAEGIITSVDPDIRFNSNGKYYYSVYANIDRVVFENASGESFPIKAGLETSSRIVLKNETILFYILRKMDFLY